MFPDFYENTTKVNIQIGDYVIVKINEASSNTLRGTAICKSKFKEFFSISKNEPFFYLENDKEALFNDYID